VKQFSGAKKWFGDLDVEDAARLITAASDVALVVSGDEQGVIRDVAFGSEELASDLADKWLGKQWIDTVTVESRSKVEALLKDAAGKGPGRWRQINHQSPRGGDVPVLYTAVQLGRQGKVIAVGRSMRPVAALQQQLIDAQQSMEREYARLRQIETRHQLMFQVSSEAVLILDATTRKIVEVNPAASTLLGETGPKLLGRLFTAGLDLAGRQALETLFASVRATGRTDSAKIRLGSDAKRECAVAVSLFREEKSAYFLVRLALAKAAAAREAGSQNSSRVFELVASSPDGFVVTEMDGRVLFANRAFLDIVQLATEDQARSESLERWLGRPGVDFNLLTSQLREHSTLRLFATTLRGEYGATTEVEICAVAVPDGDTPCCGFTIRDVSKRLKTESHTARERPRSVEQLTELVGRVPLKELVRESTDMIERLCIEAALELTNDNRASAAEILGLSRQSLYAKLRRYGLGDLDPIEDEHLDSGAEQR
jgi:transcriptional regulator PpsR